MSSNGEIIIVTFPFSGHIFPATELATLLASRNYQITLLLPSVPSSPLHPLIRVVQGSSPPSGAPTGHNQGPPNGSSTEDILARLLDERDSSSPPLLCVIVDMMIADVIIQVCTKHGVPAASLFTASACVAALEHALSDVKLADAGPDGTFVVPGLPEEMALTTFNLSPSTGSHVSGPMTPPGHHAPPSLPLRHAEPPLGHHAPPPFGHPGFNPPMPPFSQSVDSQGHDSFHFGPPGQGQHGGPPSPPAMGLGQTDKAIALLFNTCDDLEHPFLEYIRKEAKKPVLAVGPLLPAQFWSAITSSTPLVHDESIRSKHDSSHTEQEVQNWLDSKSPGTVIYISFGSANTPCDAELVELAAGLENSNQPFIWVIQKSVMKHDPSGLPIHEDGASSFNPNEVQSRVGDRGLIIRGWAPQLMILSHKSMGGFLTHCGWNSTVEALGCGVPMLTWPIHGDQIYNAKLVTKQLRVGHVLKTEGQGSVKSEQVVLGIDKLMKDEETMERVKAFSKDVFGKGFPTNSANSVDAFLDLIDAKRTNTQ
ncbi:hypothetical protein LUZ60_007303 [Juncus effusus]|nr:hypothetical protein LUZ60_007303 [Juncus effusus]